MKKYLLTILVAIIILIPVKSFAWGKKGHALVAEVAFSYLDANIQKIVLQYLDGMTIEDASNWMDNLRNDHSYDYLKPLHYTNVEKGQNVVPNDEKNIISALQETIKDLKNYKSLPKEDVKIKICMLFHLVGDLHQPLHVGYGEDKGGNTFQINFNNKGTNLHSLFDSGIIEYKGLTLQDCLNSESFTKKEFSQISKIDVISWANESRNYLDTIYSTDGHKVGEAYINKNYIIIQQQILKGGIRLSSLLKDIFK